MGSSLSPTEKRRRERERNTAIADARRMFGKNAMVRENPHHHPPMLPRCTVGELTLGIFFSVAGQGASWDEAFAHARLHKHPDYQDCCRNAGGCCDERRALAAICDEFRRADAEGIAASERQTEALALRKSLGDKVPRGWGSPLAVKHAAAGFDWCQCSACLDAEAVKNASAEPSHA